MRARRGGGCKLASSRGEEKSRHARERERAWRTNRREGRRLVGRLVWWRLCGGARRSLGRRRGLGRLAVRVANIHLEHERAVRSGHANNAAASASVPRCVGAWGVCGTATHHLSQEEEVGRLLDGLCGLGVLEGHEAVASEARTERCVRPPRRCGLEVGRERGSVPFALARGSVGDDLTIEHDARAREELAQRCFVGLCAARGGRESAPSTGSRSARDVVEEAG